MMDESLRNAARVISSSDALIVTAGAGMGADSGLPTFRGKSSFANAYPIINRLGLSYKELASPAIFDRDPHLAWGFHGLCARIYRSTKPHDGFFILKNWIESKPLGGFVYTSNIDGHFQRAGFDRSAIIECHGTAHRLQCTVPCPTHTWEMPDDPLQIDEHSMRAMDPLPHCPHCGALARPNVRFFDDAQWVGEETNRQSKAFENWKAKRVGKSIAMIECGAGTEVPAARLAGEWAILQLRAKLIRINPEEADVLEPHISIPRTALKALQEIQRLFEPCTNP